VIKHRLAAAVSAQPVRRPRRLQGHDIMRRQRPAWADLQAIKRIYWRARALGLCVDHIIPLRGQYVSGLHVENNLQLVAYEVNERKGNSFIPGL